MRGRAAPVRLGIATIAALSCSLILASQAFAGTLSVEVTGDVKIIRYTADDSGPNASDSVDVWTEADSTFPHQQWVAVGNVVTRVSGDGSVAGVCEPRSRLGPDYFRCRPQG